MNHLYRASARKRHIRNKKIEDFEEMADEAENFQDATENVQVATEMDLVSAIEETNGAVNLFLNNKHLDAMERLKPWASSSIYHAMSYGWLCSVQAFLSMAQTDIDFAIEVLKTSADVCNRHRRKNTMTNNMVTKMVVRPNYNAYVEDEVQAELCYAECLLARALVTFIQDDNLMSFIRGGLRIRSCYQSYKTCLDMLEYREWKNDALKKQFECGVNLGIGTFNLLISTLPGRVLKLLEFVGFSGNRELGYKKLEAGRTMEHTLRWPLCSLIIVVYHTVIRYALGKGCQDLDYVEKVAGQLVKSYPNSALIQFIYGRFENTRGNAPKAIGWLEKSLKLTLDWKNFQHLSLWELAWCHMLKGDYRQAIPLVDILCKESSWSRSTFNYMKAAQLLMCDDCTAAEKKDIIETLKKVPTLKLHYSGKSIPLEKFFCKKADKFTAQGNVLYYPVYEMMYVWNYFIFLKGKTDILNRIIAKLDRSLEDLKATRKGWEYFGDNYCLAMFLKGLCLRYMNTPLSAEECFKEVLKNQKTLKDDTYLTSCAAMELGFIYTETKNYPLATQYLETARNERAFFMEFRVHQGFEEIEAVTKKKTQPESPTTPTSPTYKTFSGEQPLNSSATKL